MTRDNLKSPLATCIAGLLLASSGAIAQSTAAWQKQEGPWKLEASFDTVTTAYSMSGTWWNLARSSNPDFDTSRDFVEIWLHPQFKVQRDLGQGLQAFGALSVGVTQNIGRDAFDYNQEGAIRFENAFVGLRGNLAPGWRHELSFGRQPFTLGTGMLLTAGSSNGYTWGGGASAKRQAWGQALIGKIGHGDWTAQAFSLEPSETAEARTNTRVEGLSLEWARAPIGKAGLSWFTVPRSDAIYPGALAPLAYIEEGRKGLDTWHGWMDLEGIVPAVPELGLRAEFARQRNDIRRVNGQRADMEAEAWLIGASYWAKTWPFAPKFSLHQARFSGDKPGTATYERFDPMFWGNGLNNWWFGANGAYSWLNSNIRSQRFNIDAYFSAQDIVQFQYVRTHADQLNSAIQYGQGLRITSSGLLVGVPERHLSDEYYFQYAHVFNPKLVVSAFFARSLPGDGLKAIATEGAKAWNTIGLTLTASY